MQQRLCMKQLRKRYTKFLIFLISLIISLFLIRFIPATSIIHSLGDWGYIGVFVAGFLFTYSITASIGIVLLLLFGKSLPFVYVAGVASVGLVLGEYFIFITSRYIVKKVNEKKFPKFSNKVQHLLFTVGNRWLLVCIGVIILLLPIPDEIGVSFIGLSRINSFQFILLSFFLNFFCVFFLLQISHLM